MISLAGSPSEIAKQLHQIADGIEEKDERTSVSVYLLKTPVNTPGHEIDYRYDGQSIVIHTGAASDATLREELAE